MTDQLVVGVATAAITVLTTVLVAWLQEIVRNRNRENSRQRRINQLKEEVAVIEAWSNARIAVASDHEQGDNVRSRARRDLDAIYQRIWEISPSPDTEERSTALRGSVTRLLLRHVPVCGLSRFTRFVYYVSLVMLLVWGSAWIASQKSWTDPVELIASVFAYLFVAVLPTSLLAWSTLRLSRRSVRRHREQEESVIACIG